MQKSLIISTTLITVSLLVLSGCPSPTEDAPETLSIKVNVDMAEFLNGFEVPEAQKITFTRTPADATGNFAVEPGLTAGLHLDPNTGIIDGTPTELSGAADYIVTFKSTGNYDKQVASTSINIAVKDFSITPSVNEISFANNVEIAEERRITYKRFPADATGSFTVKPDLPAGLKLDPKTGIIEGTPTTLSDAADYTVTFSASAPYTGRSATAAINIAVVELAITASTSEAVFAQNGDFSGENGISFKKIPGDAAGQFNISPKLPTGLSLDTASGLISGTPTEVAAESEYTVTLTGSGDYAGKTVSTTLTLTVAPFTITPNRTQVIYQKGEEIPEASRVSFTASPASLTGVYTISPDLPDGLSMDKSTGIIGGRATAAIEKSDFRVTFSGNGIYRGSAEANVNITIASLTPSTSQLRAEIGKVTSGIILTRVPSDMTGIFKISPDLPAGLTMDGATGSISGTPTTNESPIDYTITLTGSGEYDRITLTTAVNIWVYKRYAPKTKAELTRAIDDEIVLQGNTANLNYINTSAITDMSDLFLRNSSFNGDISGWNVGKVTNMQYMFSGANAFNGDISDWNVSNVTDMKSMFSGASAFNGDISRWNVGKVTKMQYMFSSATVFNRDISGWNVSKVTEMVSMFNNAAAFNGDISGWDVGIVTNMSFMFTSAAAFNGDISGWNVGMVTNMDEMFKNAALFNQNISGWNVGKVTAYRDFRTDSALTDANTPKKFKDDGE